ncbi:MAG: sulfurtransferase TusA family protein [Thermoplasmata archaeon]
MDLDGCLLPDGFLYDLEQNVWAVPDGDHGEYKVGVIAAFAAFIGLAQQMTYRPLTATVDRGRSLGLLETVRFTGAVRAPLTGVVLEQNPGLLDRPRWINDEPYGKGWVARIRASGGVPPELESAERVRARLTTWIREHRVRCWPATPDYQMFEIGLECSAILAQLNDELARRPAGTAVMIVTDDPTSPIEMERWSDQTGHALLAKRREAGLFEFLVRKEEHPVPRVPRRG